MHMLGRDKGPFNACLGQGDGNPLQAHGLDLTRAQGYRQGIDAVLQLNLAYQIGPSYRTMLAVRVYDVVLKPAAQSNLGAPVRQAIHAVGLQHQAGLVSVAVLHGQQHTVPAGLDKLPGSDLYQGVVGIGPMPQRLLVSTEQRLMWCLGPQRLKVAGLCGLFDHAAGIARPQGIFRDFAVVFIVHQIGDCPGAFIQLGADTLPVERVLKPRKRGRITGGLYDQLTKPGYTLGIGSKLFPYALRQVFVGIGQLVAAHRTLGTGVQVGNVLAAVLYGDTQLGSHGLEFVIACSPRQHII